MATYVITIGGAAKSVQHRSLSISSVINGHDTLTADVFSVDASYRPALGDEVLVTENGTNIFGGIIDGKTEQGLGGDGVDPIVTTIQASSFNSFADERLVTEDIAAGNLKAALTVLVAYLTDRGVSLDAGQVNGPALPALHYENRKLTDVLNELTDISNGYVWRIDGTKTLSMFLPGTDAAPFDIATGDGNAIGDIRVGERKGEYANRVVVVYGSAGKLEIVDTFTGDGSTDTFDLTADFFYGRGYVNNNGTNEGFNAPPTLQGPGFEWDLLTATNQIQRVSPFGAPANGNTITVTYDALFPASLVVEDTVAQAADGYIKEIVVQAPNVYSKAIAQAIGDAKLAEFAGNYQTVEYDTEGIGLEAGMSQDVNVPERNAVDTYTISEIELSQPAGDIVRRAVTLVEGSRFRGSYRDVYKTWAERGSGGSLTEELTNSPGGIPPGGSDTAIQFNDKGGFGGTATLTFDKTIDYLFVNGTLDLTPNNQSFGLQINGQITRASGNMTALDIAPTMVLSTGSGSRAVASVIEPSISTPGAATGVTITSLYGQQIDPSLSINGSDVVTNYFGQYIFGGSLGASPTNCYGLYLEQQSDGSTLNYALYSQGPNYLLGPNILEGYIEGLEMSAPSAPGSNRGRLYFEDNGSGKTRLMCLFNTGAAQQIAIQP